MLRRVAVMLLVGLCLVDDAMARAARGQGVHEVQIEGTVQTPDGAVLPGATVHIFGTSLTTTSDGDGPVYVELHACASTAHRCRLPEQLPQ